ncbi:hypothetical protein CLPU_17c00150 [Gottschalkia purinilytica]|uniref:Uncharacterized protein n=1 Tax=Gottschalkia purinilytica TaxID=1503 RepID=A0A0L0W7W6_GOTPU|nr:CD1247 N-terminal domain-containing protein [Gottschalkia purinilytica]KNF07390.1 hypothetical protein CLPU_17c00150 [Gottschalkia purinilytica]
MEFLRERISYLRGLAEGLEIEESSREGKLLLHIIDTLDDFADAIIENNENQEDLEDYVECIDEDLTDLEDEIYVDLDDEFEDYDYEDDDDIEYVDVECPHCSETIYLDRELLDDETICPNCKENMIKDI